MKLYRTRIYHSLAAVFTLLTATAVGLPLNSMIVYFSSLKILRVWELVSNRKPNNSSKEGTWEDRLAPKLLSVILNLT